MSPEFAQQIEENTKSHEQLDNLVKNGEWRLISNESFPELSKEKVTISTLHGLHNSLFDKHRARREFSFLHDEISDQMKVEAKECFEVLFPDNNYDEQIDELVDRWLWLNETDIKQIGLILDLGLPEVFNTGNLPWLNALDDETRNEMLQQLQTTSKARRNRARTNLGLSTEL